jgi:acyl carrier protein
MDREEHALSLPVGGDTTTLHFDPARPLQVTLSIDTAQGIITLKRSHQEHQASPLPKEPSDALIRDTLHHASLEQEVAQIFATVLELPRDAVDSSTDFFACGGDSLATVAVVAAVEERFHLHIDPVTVFDHPVVSDLTVSILEHWRMKADAGLSRSEEALS